MIDLHFYYLLFTGVQEAWVLASIVWLWLRRDELPLLISAFLGFIFSFRFWAILNGYAAPVDISPFGFEPISFQQGLEAHGIAALSETLMLTAYMMTQRQKLVPRTLVAPPGLHKWLNIRVFLFAVVAIPVVIYTRQAVDSKVSGGAVMAFEVSAYLYELPLVLISVALLLALLWKFGGLRNSQQYVAAILIMAAVAALTFGPTGRFQFIGWVLAVTLIASAGDALSLRLVKMGLGFGAALLLFTVAGALRNTSEDTSMKEDTITRLLSAEDANMLDGLALLRQVYPDKLPYSYGGEHLEILERPIPRAWWPGKPVGGYMNKLGLTSVGTGFTLGISPGLVGSFYQEGGVIGVGVLSLLYGYGLGRLIRFSARIVPFAGVLIRAVCCASIIPLLRGGDLPGIYAWIFMAFWPCFFILLVWRRELFVQQAFPGTRPRRRPRVQPVRADAPGVLRPS